MTKKTTSRSKIAPMKTSVQMQVGSPLDETVDSVAPMAVSAPMMATSSAPAEVNLVKAATIIPLETLAKVPDNLITGEIVRDSNAVAISANVIWPDGTAGTYTTDAVGTSGTIDAYHLTYGIPTQVTFTQPLITRGSFGEAIIVPEIVIT